MATVSPFHLRNGLLQRQSQTQLGSVFLTPACALGTEVGCWVYLGPVLECTATMVDVHLFQNLGNTGEKLMKCGLHGPQARHPRVVRPRIGKPRDQPEDGNVPKEESGLS